MAKSDQRTASARRAARVRRATTRSWGVERLEERTVLSGAGTTLLVYVIDLSEVRGWDPPQVAKAPTSGYPGLQRSVLQLDNAMVVFVRATAGSRSGAGGGEDGPEGESSGNVPLNAALRLRAPETPSQPSRRAPDLTPPPVVSLPPVFSRETPASTSSAVSSSNEPESALAAPIPTVQVVAPGSPVASRPTWLVPPTDLSKEAFFAEVGLHTTAAANALGANRGEQVLGQSELLLRGGESARTTGLVDPQILSESDQASTGQVVEETGVGEDAWQVLNRTKRLRFATSLRGKPPAATATLPQLIGQFPNMETWAVRMDADPATELALVLTADAARRVAAPSAPQTPEEEGGAVTLTVEEVGTAGPDTPQAIVRDEQDKGGLEVESLQDVEVRMEFRAERYQAFDVSTEPTPVTDLSRDMVVRDATPRPALD